MIARVFRVKTLRSMWWEMRRVRAGLDAGFSSRGEIYTTHVESRAMDVMISVLTYMVETAHRLKTCANYMSIPDVSCQPGYVLCKTSAHNVVRGSKDFFFLTYTLRLCWS